MTHANSPAFSTMHPLHGMLASYPLAFFTGAVVTDIAYASTTQIMWADFSIWLITGGLLFGVFAALAGIADALLMRGRKRRRRSWVHNGGTALMMVLALINAFVHSRDAWTSVVPTGMILSLVVAVLALVTSWVGYSVETREGAH